MVPLISVVVPVFNKEKFLESSLASVLAQSHAEWELIVVDDGSTDGSRFVAESILDQRVRVVSIANGGPGPARNHGIDQASGEWVALLDADDLWRPSHLDEIANLISTYPLANIVSTQTNRSTLPGDAAFSSGYVNYFQMAVKHRGVLTTSAVAVRRAAVMTIGGFKSFYPGQDTELWARLALSGVVAVTSKVTVDMVDDYSGITHSYARGNGDVKERIVIPELLRLLRERLEGNKGGESRESVRKYMHYKARQIIKGEVLRKNFKAAAGIADYMRFFWSAKLLLLCDAMPWAAEAILRVRSGVMARR